MVDRRKGLEVVLWLWFLEAGVFSVYMIGRWIEGQRLPVWMLVVVVSWFMVGCVVNWLDDWFRSGRKGR
jgi:hypothetical protein